MEQVSKNSKFVFFGSSAFSVIVLERLKQHGLLPSFIVTTPNSRKGRGLELTSPEVRVWAESHKIPFIQPESLKYESTQQEIMRACHEAKLFVVASYGKIIPASIFNIPPKKTLNIHPSLLPKFRGPTPIQSALLEADETGVSIILIDEKVDHGPIIAQRKTDFQEWPLPYPQAEKILAHDGADLLAEILTDWLSDKMVVKEQDHERATFTEKIEKKDGEISLNAPAEENYRKYCAYASWPGIYFFVESKGKKIRIAVKEASLKDNQFIIERVIPEGKKLMRYEDFLKGLR